MWPQQACHSNSFALYDLFHFLVRHAVRITSAHKWKLSPIFDSFISGKILRSNPEAIHHFWPAGEGQNKLQIYRDACFTIKPLKIRTAKSLLFQGFRALLPNYWFHIHSHLKQDWQSTLTSSASIRDVSSHCFRDFRAQGFWLIVVDVLINLASSAGPSCIYESVMSYCCIRTLCNMWPLPKWPVHQSLLFQSKVERINPSRANW